MPPSSAEAAMEAPSEADRLAKARTLTAQAESLIAAGRYDRAAEVAREATAQAVDRAAAWDVLARALEGQGDSTRALIAYGEAYARGDAPADRNWSTALRLGEYAAAEQFLATHLAHNPPTPEAIAGLARAQAGQQAFDQARETLRTALEADAAQPLLWLTLGQILMAEGRHTQAVAFLEEALRLDPAAAWTRAALADALLLGVGDTARAVDLGDEALAAAAREDLPALMPAQARRLLAAGRLAQGWAALAAGAEPGPASAIEIRAAAPRWTPGMALNGRLVLFGEEVLADELLLAQAIPGLIAEGLPLILAVDRSWVNLAHRSFPNAMVVSRLGRTRNGKRQLAVELDSPHVHANELVAAWAPLRGMMPARRATPADFADPTAYLTPDSGRVAHWRGRLAQSGLGLKVGLTWRTPVDGGLKAWETPLIASLAGVLSAPGVQLVDLEPEEVFGEVDLIRELYGLQIDVPPDLNRADLGDLAALARAVDLVIGPPDVATYLAAACGAETWFLAPPGHWAQLGTGTYPWFPKARVFGAAASDDWADVMSELSRALAERAPV